jgi:uncharacterized RDD family membrane protein YckC
MRNPSEAYQQNNGEIIMQENEAQAANPNPYAPPQTILTTPDVGQYRLASRGKRLGGTIIDSIVLTICTLPVVIIFFGGWSAYTERVGDVGFFMQLAMTLFSIVVFFLINGYLLVKNGQTIGKKLLGTKIVRTDGSAADLQRIMLRRYIPISVAYVIPIVGYLIGIINALLIFRESHKCGHDELADTIVVEANPT